MTAHPVRTTSAVLAAVLALALVATGATSSVADAARNAAKNSVTSKSIKNGTVKSQDLKDGAVTGADLADGSVGSVDVADGSLGSADVADDGLTGADVAEGTLGLVPNAAAVGGVQVTPLSLSLPSTANGVVVLNQAGSTLVLDCEGVGGRFVAARTAGGAPVLVTGIYGGGNATASSLAPGDSADVQVGDAQYTVAIVVPSGGAVTAQFTLIHELNASGTDDCFFRGTITRVP